jgi:CheY-like chemotaxis protein/HPt (histidine-containing phosphotransfer) domain-containing protein
MISLPTRTRIVLGLPSARVLVADDGAENRELVSLALSEQGLWVDQAENGQIAVDMVMKVGYDVILMDMQMPVLDGFGATRALRAKGVTTPIVALTANVMAGYETEMLAAGCDVYMTKPIDIDALLAIIARLLKGEHVDAAPPIVSRLAGQSQFWPIIRNFVAQLPVRVSKADAACVTGDGKQVEDFAHWLKGSGGSMGFDEFTEPAAQLEQAAKAGEMGEAARLLGEVHEIARRVVPPEKEATAL